ncbi:MAG: hypothetical protein K0U23_01515 [Gammaproteobacteria bacterium]|nr:hypothetical protein [Gammaproteobacteria bacterium]
MDYENTDIENMDMYEDSEQYLNDSKKPKSSKKSKKSKKTAEKDLRHVTRRKIEDVLAFKRLKSEHGWMDDFDLDFGEVY